MAEIDKIIHYMKYYFCKIQLKKKFIYCRHNWYVLYMYEMKVCRQ